MTIQHSPKQGRRVGTGSGGAFARALGQDDLRLIPKVTVDARRDCWRPYERLADLDPVVQHPIVELLVDALALAGGDAPLGKVACWRQNSFLVHGRNLMGAARAAAEWKALERLP